MDYETVKNQKDAANENLVRINAPFRLSFMSQNKHTRITIEIGTPEQIERGCCQNSVLPYASLNDASKFLMGFNACLNSLSTYNLPVNKNP